MSAAVLVDVDGTLVDTNYHHVIAWGRAFADHGLHPSLWRVHRHIGMGGDQLVAAVTDDEVEQQHGDALRAAWESHFDELLDEIQVLDGAPELLRTLADRGHDVVLATSGKPHHVERFVDLLRSRDVVTAWTTSEDVERTKPAPDLLQVAWSHSDADTAVAVGDSTWDFRSAAQLGLTGVGLLTGGFSAAELREAGATYVVKDLPELRDSLDRVLPGEG